MSTPGDQTYLPGVSKWMLRGRFEDSAKLRRPWEEAKGG